MLPKSVLFCPHNVIPFRYNICVNNELFIFKFLNSIYRQSFKKQFNGKTIPILEQQTKTHYIFDKSISWNNEAHKVSKNILCWCACVYNMLYEQISEDIKNWRTIDNPELLTFAS